MTLSLKTVIKSVGGRRNNEAEGGEGGGSRRFVAVTGLSITQVIEGDALISATVS